MEEYGFGPELSLDKLPRHSFDEFDKRQTYVNYGKLLKIDKRCTKHAQVFLTGITFLYISKRKPNYNKRKTLTSQKSWFLKKF